VNPDILVKVVVTPILIGTASLAGRRFGDAVGGWFVGLPLTSAPILYFLTVERGPKFGAVAAVGILAGAVMPGSGKSRPTRAVPTWDIPLRMFLATVLVVALTSAAPVLGPHLAGLLSPLPVFAAMMAVFAHRSGGPVASRDVLRGFVFGLFSFAAFFAIAALTIIPFGIATGLLLGTVAALLTQISTLAAMRRSV
jgi:hypothetical protein